MSTNEYALKFAREAYQNAVRSKKVNATTLAKLKAAYDREDQIFRANLLQVAS